ncbi:MAG TPA: DNA methyltransferase [Chloroflexota bacterium]|nr:DNA methyltransferase [Chloroflexota bacterium]
MAELLWNRKYDATGRRTAPARTALPLQSVESVDGTTQQPAPDRREQGGVAPWRNRLIWGDTHAVLPSLLPEFAGTVDLIYIDPPFSTGANFSCTTEIPHVDAIVTNEPAVIARKAYRDSWGRDLDGYLHWFYETVVLLHDLLSATGSVYVHLDWHVGHYARAVLDEVFGREHFLNEVIWWYYNKLQGNINRFPSNHDVIFWYRKSERFVFHPQQEPREQKIRQIRRIWDREKGKLVNLKNDEGHVVFQESSSRGVDDVWRLSMLQPADKQNLGYATQKPEPLLERIVRASSDEGDLVLDCFCGSGTTAAVAERLNRRWITCDLGRFAIQTTRKRLLAMPCVRAFVVQTLGTYERQAWQAVEFSAAGPGVDQQTAYRRFILDLYHATPVEGYAHLHGVKDGRFVSVGSVDAAVTVADVQAIACECRSAGGAEAPTSSAVDVLGWDFAFDPHQAARAIGAATKVLLAFRQIPREVLEKKAVEQGDIRFFAPAALTLDVSAAARAVTLALSDFTMSLDDLPSHVLRTITHWSQLIDYWAVDWHFQGDTFHNCWQSYRTRADPTLQRQATHQYAQAGPYRIMVKAIDLLGTETIASRIVEVP